MSFTRAKPAGWTDNVDPITATQINQIDVNQSRALDGTGGGTYSPSTALTIGGSGVTLSNGNVFGYNSRDVTRYLALVADTSSGNWSRANTPRGAWQNTAAGGTLDLRLEGIPHDNVLKTLIVRWIGAAGHGALPVLPDIELFKIDQDGTETSVATASDTSGSVVAYEAAHSITMSSISHTIDLETYRYVLVLSGESGGNFVTGGKVLSLQAVVTVTSQSEW